MSHVIRVKIKVKNLAALIAAGAELGLEFVEGQKTYKWFGQWVGDYALPEGFTAAQLGHCTHAMRLRNGDSRTYEVGIVETATPGEFELLWDFWAGGYGLQAAIGEGGSKLIAGYVQEQTRQTLDAQGWMYQENEGGSILAFVPGGGTVTIGPDGMVEADGFTGQGCAAPSLTLAEALGTSVNTTVKAAFWQNDQTLHIQEGGF